MLWRRCKLVRRWLRFPYISTQFIFGSDHIMIKTVAVAEIPLHFYSCQSPLQAGARARVGGLCGACFFGMVSWRAGFSVKTAFAADEAGVARLQRWTRPTCRPRRRRQSAVC
eukprot:SAG25_NODE_596_length_6668_cov_212.169889_4_plen_112_part_00